MKRMHGFTLGLSMVFMVSVMNRPCCGTGLLSEEKLYQLIAQELADTLDSPQRFSVLPNNLLSIYASSDSVPIFTISPMEYYPENSLAKTGEWLSKRDRGFGLMIDGKVIGVGQNGELVISDPRGARTIITDGNHEHTVKLPQGLAIRSAMQINGQWLFNTSGGMLNGEGTHPYPGLDDLVQGSVTVKTDDGLVIIKSGQRRSDSKTFPLTIGLLDKNGLGKYDFPQVPGYSAQGAIFLKNKNWLVIGNKLVVLDRPYAPSPSEADLENALKAAERGDHSSFLKAVEKLTLYHADDLRGLAKLLSGLPDPILKYRGLNSAGQHVMRQLEPWAKPPNDPNHVQQRIQELVQRYTRETEQFMRDVSRAVGDEGLFTPVKAAQYIKQGYQYFNGQWISNVRLLKQKSEREALLLLNRYNNQTGVNEQGMFRLRDDGKLHPVTVPKGSFARSSLGSLYVGEHDGKELLFFPRHGLAALEDGVFKWLDQGHRIKMMERVLGCDKNGRIYFSESSRFRDEAGENMPVYWTCRVNADEPGEAPGDFTVLPVDYDSTVDASGRLWFVTKPAISSRDTDGVLRTALPESDQRKLDWSNEKQSGSSQAMRGSTRTTLYAYTQGKLYRYFTDPSLDSARLMAGSSGALFALAAPGLRSSFVIEDDVVTSTKDLHGLARENFDLLMRTAPTYAPLPSTSISSRYRENYARSGVCRTDDLVWVHDENRIEAYRKGAPMQIHRRLTLLGANVDRASLYGPIGHESPSMILITHSSSIPAVFWATVGEKGIALRQSSEPGADWPGGGHLTRAGSFHGYPLLAPRRETIFYYNGFHRIWACTAATNYQAVVDSGRPVQVTRSGDLLVYRHVRTYRGYRLMLKEGLRDITESFVRPMKIVAELEEGQLLFISPKSLGWLKPNDDGDYDVVKEVAVREDLILTGFLGKTSSGLAFLAENSRGRKQIVLWSAPRH